MDIPKLNRSIVEKRMKKAPLLRDIVEACGCLKAKLRNVADILDRLNEIEAPGMRKSRSDIQELVQELDVLRDRAELRRRRFENGLVTVSIAGLEKAGKTTFLRSLTGIEALPAFDERCTAVACEILFSENRSDFDIEFYDEKEFMERVVRPVCETVAEALPDDVRNRFVPPATASEFVGMKLPEPDALPGGTTAYKLLKDLKQLKAHFHECRANLGREPIARRPLSELNQWVSYKQSKADGESDEAELRGRQLARVSAAKTCRIFTEFTGGSEHLRWIDTPGVDDPNRRARDIALSAIASETDLLVVASRPGANPSPGENFHHFWDSVSRLPDEIHLMDRLLFALNLDRRVDPNGENIKIHKKYLTDAGVPEHLFIGPFEATKPSDAAALMDAVNGHLSRRLADQDEAVANGFVTWLKNVQARIRLVYESLAKSRPSDAGLKELEIEEFHKWFHWYEDDRDQGFWTDLVKALDQSARAIGKDPRILESENSLYSIFAEEAESIQSKIPSAQALEEFVVKQRGENPIPNGMRTISTYFSRLINRLSNEIQQFGPIMQDEIVAVLERAGLMSLLVGKTSAEKLSNLLKSFESRKPDSHIVEVLRETLDLPRNVKYVLRYELRPAVDFCDPTLWDDQETAWNRLTDMMTANNGEPQRLAVFETNRHPPVTDSREKDSELLKKIAGNAMLGIQTVLKNERHLPRRIADDFMRDCRVRLCFAPESEQEWRTLLFANRGTLLASTIGRIRDKSELIQSFYMALSQLETSLP